MKGKHNNYKTVVVLGPPRSGTSMTAGVLSILGVDMGLIRKPDPENPKGYFEDKDFLGLTDRIFESAKMGSNGFKPPTVEKILAQREQFGESIGDLIEKRLSKCSSDIWGWKVTGTCLTIELFLPYLIDPYFIIVWRNPLNIAKSAVRYTRNKPRLYDELALPEALKITGIYNAQIHHFLENYPKLPKAHVSFEDFLNDSVKETKRLGQFLGIKVTAEQLEQVSSLVLSRGKMGRFRTISKLRFYFTKQVRRWLNKKKKRLFKNSI